MADDDKDFSFGTIDDDLSSDDGWGSLEGESENTGDSLVPDGTENWGDDSVAEPDPPPSLPTPGDEEPPETGAKKSSSRMILYGLLVIVLSAAGFYYFTTSPLPPVAKKRSAAASQTLAMPERPEPVAVPESALVAPTVTDSTKSIPKGTLLEVMPEEIAPASSVTATPASTSPAAATPAPVVAAPVKAVAPPAKVVAAQPKSKTTVPMKKTPGGEKTAAGTYSIQVGAFADALNRDEALAKIRQLGFDPQVVPVKKMMPMTRLLIGVYAPEEGRKKARELAATIPTAFPLHQGKQIAVYAGSFSSPEDAQVFIGELKQKGIQVSVQKAEVELTLSRVTFGSFRDQAAATAAGTRAQALGLETNVVRNH